MDPTEIWWTTIETNSNWVFRYDPNSMRIIGYNINNNNLIKHSPFCLRKHQGISVFKKKTLEDIKYDYSYLKIIPCEKEINPEEQFLLTYQPQENGKLQFSIDSPLQKASPTSFVKLLQEQNYEDLSDPDKILCTGNHHGYLWMGACKKNVESYWKEKAFFHWDY